MDDMTLPQRFEDQVVGGPGQVGKALLGTDKGGGSHMQVGISGKEVADLPVFD
jgi:hypothetical protein